MNPKGYHYIVEASGCDPKILEDPAILKKILLEAARIGRMDIRITHFYKFTPRGVSGMVVVSGSHISIHTWPECGYAAIDVYICGETSEPEKTIKYILESIRAKYAHITEIERGIEDEEGLYTHTIVSWDEFPMEEE
ncbi:MAG: adenosylmethionine decarboxylase [Thermoprotei archaeon]|nr:MAG: adenosylmethionine decarboxylase [Thermoprotei archaeon]